MRSSPAAISATFLSDRVVRARGVSDPHHQATVHLLSPLDMALAGAGPVSQTFYFSERLDAARLVQGLSAALDQFPMVAGRLTMVRTLAGYLCMHAMPFHARRCHACPLMPCIHARRCHAL